MDLSGELIFFFFFYFFLTVRVHDNAVLLAACRA